MVSSTAGMRLRHRSRAWRDAVGLVSAMQFAISLLTAICFAPVVGTVVANKAGSRALGHRADLHRRAGRW